MRRLPPNRPAGGAAASPRAGRAVSRHQTATPSAGSETLDLSPHWHSYFNPEAVSCAKAAGSDLPSPLSVRMILSGWEVSMTPRLKS